MIGAYAVTNKMDIFERDTAAKVTKLKLNKNGKLEGSLT